MAIVLAPVLAALLGATASGAGADPAHASTSAGPDRARLITLHERTEDGALKRYPASSVVDLDVNSSVLVEFSPEALSSLSRVSAPGVVRAETVRRLKQLADVQAALNAALRKFEGQDEIREAATRAGRALQGPALERYQAAYKALEAAFGKIEEYMGEQAASELVDSGQNVSVAARRYLAEEHRRLQEQVREDLDKVPIRALTVTARIRDRFIHVPGYDDLTPGQPRLVDKARFHFDKEFDDEVAAAKALAKKASDWNALIAAARDAARRRLADLERKVAEVAESAGRVAKKAEADKSDKVKEAVKEIAEAARTLRGAVSDASQALAAASRPGPDAEPEALLRGTVLVLQEVGTSARGALQQLSSALAKLKQAKAGLAQEVDALLGTIDPLKLRFDIFDVGSTPNAATLAPEVAASRVKLEEALPTEISLLTTDRQEGDVLTISVRVFDDDGGEGRPVPGGETTAHLRVRSRGLVADTGAVVLFTRPLKHDPGPFVPAAGAYAVFRLKGWRSDGSANANFLYYTAPGLGVCAVAIPRSSDGATQIAWMGTFHLFGDVLQASLGTTTDASPVWGIGLGLHRIAGLGKYFQ